MFKLDEKQQEILDKLNFLAENLNKNKMDCHGFFSKILAMTTVGKKILAITTVGKKILAMTSPRIIINKEIKNSVIIKKNLPNSIIARTKGDEAIHKNSNYKSFYIYGDVGRGKTMLMKSFYNNLECEKSYFHFNNFMQQIHQNLRDIRKESKKYKDELIEATKRIIKKTKIICFDEFQVSDIADAMLLSRIFTYVFSQNISVIFTSNFEPHLLYQDGLQREKFLEFVDNILLKNCEILNLNSKIDYRQNFKKSDNKRYFLAKNDEPEFLEKIQNITKNNNNFTTKLKVWGRVLEIENSFEISQKQILQYLDFDKNVSNNLKEKIKLAIFDFDWLIKNKNSASDFRAIAKEFDLIFLSKVFSFSKFDFNEAKRFVFFIDEIYENKTAIFILAENKIENIFDEYYLKKSTAKIFTRSLSRINEIKSDDYFIKSKIFKN